MYLLYYVIHLKATGTQRTLILYSQLAIRVNRIYTIIHDLHDFFSCVSCFIMLILYTQNSSRKKTSYQESFLECAFMLVFFYGRKFIWKTF